MLYENLGLIRAWYKCDKCNGAKHGILPGTEEKSYFYCCKDETISLKDNELVLVRLEASPQNIVPATFCEDCGSFVY